MNPQSANSLPARLEPISRSDQSLDVPPRNDGGNGLQLFESAAVGSGGSLPNDADSYTRRALAAADVLGASAAFALTIFLLGGHLSAIAVGVAATVVALNKLLGLYDRDAHVLNKTTLDEAPMLINSAMMLAFLGAGAYDLASPSGSDFDARHLAILVALTATALAVGRVAARRIVRVRLPAERCLVIGGQRECRHLSEKIASSPTVRARIVGRAPMSVCASAGLRELREAIAVNRVDRVIVVPDERDPEEVSEAIRALKSFGVKMSIVPRLLESVGASVERDEICGIEMIGVKDFRMTRSSRVVKRTLDVTLAGIGLVLAAPLFAIAALAIKLDSPGPVFYRQRRIGLDGAPFFMYKFRTMVDGADRQKQALREHNETSGLFKIADDPRITRVGRYLRRSALDELPQLINVLTGDMSLVGPRPLVPDEDENITGWYRRRSHITPGITGVWQLHGPVRIPLHEMVKIDYTYVANWSLWADVKILMRTVPHVLGRRGL
jgi:exopolysaccharide biosynthesis polyprenyl glycosylphosphotransferase